MDSDVIAAALGNHLIVREILKGFSWLELESCSKVSTMWSEVVARLIAEEGLRPQSVSFSFDRFGGFSPKKVRRKRVFAFLFVNSSYQKRNGGQSAALMKSCRRFCDFSIKMVVAASAQVYHYPPAPPKYQLNPAVAGVSFPAIPGVRFSTFKSFLPWRESSFGGPHHFSVLTARSGKLFLANEAVQAIATTNTVKCVIFYTDEKHSTRNLEELKLLMNIIFSENGQRCALGGCIVDSSTIDACGSSIENPNRYCMTLVHIPKGISAKAKFDCYSYALTKYQLELGLEKMSQLIKMRENSFALKYTCCERSLQHYKECRLFSEKFPTTSIIGCEAMGEICLKHLPSEPEPAEEASGSAAKKRKVEGRLIKNVSAFSLTYSTVFVVFTWGKKL